MKNILHLSDLHFSTSTKYGFHIENAQKLINSLVRDIKMLKIPIDTIFITGDISFSGQANEYEEINNNFIQPLLEELKLTKDNLYLVPGNHDMDRSKVSRVELITRKSCNSNEIKEVYSDINNKNDSWGRLDNYNLFSQKIKNEQTNIIFDSPLFTVRKVGKDLLIHCINSAWLSCDDEDQGLLRILPLLSETLQKNKAKNNILLMHHPLDWLSKDEINLVSKYIEKNIDAVFYGHMHEFEQSITINFNHDITLKIQAGTIDLRNKNSGYSLVSLDSVNSFKYGRIYYRKYVDTTISYKPWTERIDNGFSDFSLDKRSIFDSSKFCDKSEELLNKIEYSHLINIGKKQQEKLKLSNIFIEPKFTDGKCMNESFKNIEVLKKYEDLEFSNGCTLISATEQQGRTTILRKIQLNYLEKQSNYDFGTIVFYIDLNFEYKSHTKILGFFLESYEGSDLRTSFDSKLKSCIDEGNALFLIDNYDRATGDTLSSINNFMKLHCKNRFIISGETDNNIENLTKIIKNYSGKIYNATISNIARCDIRQMISKHTIISSFHSDDELFNNITNVVDNSQLPHNHFVYSILLIIYEEKNNLIGILNEADIIENYIEILLHKHCITTSNKSPVYKVLLHLLGFICSKLILEKRNFLSEKELNSYIVEFEKLTFYDFPLNSYIKPVVDSGILITNNNITYEFSNYCFLYFFSAYYMNYDQTLKDFVFSDENYLKLEKIVEYYASYNSTNFDVLDFFEKKVTKARKEICDDIHLRQDINIELLNIDDIPSISLLDFASTSEEFEDTLNNYNVEQSKYDDTLDKRRPLRGKKSNNTSNLVGEEDTFDTVSLITHYKKELSLLSKVFRNTELVMDPNEVMRIFDLILDSYIFYIKANLASLNENVVLPLLIPAIEEQMYSDEIKEIEKEKLLDDVKVILSIIRAFVPNMVIDMLSNNLSTKKPRFINILNKKLSSVDSNSMDSMLIRFLLLEIERNKFSIHIKELYKNQGKVASGSLFFKLCELKFTRHDFNHDEKNMLNNKIKKLIMQNKTLNKASLQKLTSMYTS